MNDIELTDEQKLLIIKTWNDNKENPPSLQELTQIAFPDVPNIDGRSKYGKAVKNFLASRELKVKTKSEYTPKDRLEFTQEQKDFISSHAATMSFVEIARNLFNNYALSNLSIESRSVEEYINTLPIQIRTLNTDTSEEDSQSQEEYKPPKNIERALFRVNKYVLDGINKDKITTKQKKDLTSLISYLHTYRFLHQIGTYTESVDRDLFESSFIRYTYDKCDLTQEEVDQYIVLATEVVISSNIQETIQTLQEQIDMEVDSGGKIPMTLVEAVTSARTEYNQSVTRQQKLLNDLKVKRSERLQNQVKENASILNLVQMWKDEDTRKEMIKMSEMRREVLKTEIGRLSSMDDIKARIFGLTEEEVLDG
jgi:hypothetical protein